MLVTQARYVAPDPDISGVSKSRVNTKFFRPLVMDSRTHGICGAEDWPEGFLTF